MYSLHVAMCTRALLSHECGTCMYMCMYEHAYPIRTCDNYAWQNIQQFSEILQVNKAKTGNEKLEMIAFHFILSCKNAVQKHVCSVNTTGMQCKCMDMTGR